MKKIFFLLIILLLLISHTSFVLAQGAIEDTGGIENNVDSFRTSAGFADVEITEIVSSVITAFLGLLGIIFVILIIYGGFMWMTAAGSEEKVSKAKNLLLRAIIGLIIIVAAYVITYFVFNALENTVVFLQMV